MEYDRVDFQTYGLDVEVYDERYAAGDPLQEGDIQFYQEYAKKYGFKPHGGPVLELGSGTGRVTLELAKLGCEVVGIDISQGMIDIAESKLSTMQAEHAKNVTFLQDDMCTFTLNDQYPLILIPARAFQCLPTTFHQKQCLKNVRKHLTDGGRLVIDVFDPQTNEMDENDWAEDIAKIPTLKHPKTGNTVKMEFIDRASGQYDQLIEDTWRYRELDNSGREIRRHDVVMRLRWAFHNQMEKMFKENGFKVVELFSDFHKSAPAKGKEQIWVLEKA